MATITSSGPGMEIPLDAYRVLERHLQAVRLAVLKRAWCIAKERHATESEPAPTDVTPADALAALEQVMRPGLCGDSSVSADVLARMPELVYLAVDHRLDGLRPLVVQTAIGLASQGGQPAAASRRTAITPEIVNLAWKLVWDNPALRRAALTRSEHLLPDRVGA